MAFTKSITWQSFPVEQAYASIQDFTATKMVDTDGNKSFRVNIHTNIWKDYTKEVCLYGVDNTVTVPYNDGEVYISALYTELALLPEWADWINV